MLTCKAHDQRNAQESLAEVICFGCSGAHCQLSSPAWIAQRNRHSHRGDLAGAVPSIFQRHDRRQAETRSKDSSAPGTSFVQPQFGRSPSTLLQALLFQVPAKWTAYGSEWDVDRNPLSYLKCMQAGSCPLVLHVAKQSSMRPVLEVVQFAPSWVRLFKGTSEVENACRLQL